MQSQSDWEIKSPPLMQGISNEVEQYFGVNKFQLGRLLRARLQARLRAKRGEHSTDASHVTTICICRLHCVHVRVL